MRTKIIAIDWVAPAKMLNIEAGNPAL